MVKRFAFKKSIFLWGNVRGKRNLKETKTKIFKGRVLKMISNSKMQMYISLNPSKFKRIATVVTMGQKKIMYVLWEGD